MAPDAFPSRLDLAKPATRAGLPARFMLMGPTKAGKTLTSLRIAKELRGKDERPVLVIDTEHGRSRIYSDRAEFVHLNWIAPYDPRALVSTLREAGDTYSVIIIDTLSAFWSDEGGLLELVDAYRGRQRDGGSREHGLQAWRVVGTPVQNMLINGILSTPVHTICNTRQKMSYEIGQDMKVSKQGLAPVQRDDLEYSFDVVGTMNLDHKLQLEARGAMDGRVYQPGRADDCARDLVNWLNEADMGERGPSEIQLDPAGTRPAQMPRPGSAPLRSEAERQEQAHAAAPAAPPEATTAPRASTTAGSEHNGQGAEPAPTAAAAPAPEMTDTEAVQAVMTAFDGNLFDRTLQIVKDLPAGWPQKMAARAAVKEGVTELAGGMTKAALKALSEDKLQWVYDWAVLLQSEAAGGHDPWGAVDTVNTDAIPF